MRASDRLVGAAFALLGAAVLLATLGFPRLEGGAPGPALFPRVLALLMVAFGAGLAARPNAAGTGGERSGWDRRAVANALAVFAAIVAFVAAAPALGFLLTAALILLGLMRWLGATPVAALLASAGLALFVYLVFGKVLHVPLPLGLLWF